MFAKKKYFNCKFFYRRPCPNKICRAQVTSKKKHFRESRNNLLAFKDNIDTWIRFREIEACAENVGKVIEW